MPASKAQQKAVNKYMKENYDRFLTTFKPKGRLDIIKAHAAAHGESANSFINRAIQEAMERDSAHQEAPIAQAEAGGISSLPPDTLKAAQEAAEAAGEAVPVFVARAVETQAQRDALSRRMEGGKANE